MCLGQSETEFLYRAKETGASGGLKKGDWGWDSQGWTQGKDGTQSNWVSSQDRGRHAAARRL